MLTICSYILYIHNTQNNKTKVKYISITHILELGKLRYNLKDTIPYSYMIFLSSINRAHAESKDLDTKLVFSKRDKEKQKGNKTCEYSDGQILQLCFSKSVYLEKRNLRLVLKFGRRVGGSPYDAIFWN